MTLLKDLAKHLRRSAWLAALLAVFAFYCTARADLTPPTSRERAVANKVAELLERDHVTQHPLDDQISERCLKTFLKDLDPWKIYFLQRDVDRFLKRKDDLDDLVKQYPSTKQFLEFAQEVFRTLLERVDQRAKLVDELLAMDHDFTVDEQIVRDPDATTYAHNDAEVREKWRKLVKLDLLSLKADGLEGEAATAKLHKRYRSRFLRLHQIDNDELLEMYLSALTTAYDPHSSYMSAKTVENFYITSMNLRLEGIGAALQSVDGETVVKRIVPAGAADKDGRLKVEDRIVGVGQGKDGEIEDVVDMKLSDVVDRIRGDAGTVVRLEVISEGSPERRIIDITRARIELKESEAQSEIFPFGKKPDGSPYRIGVIGLSTFYMDMEGARKGLLDYKSTTRDVRRILQDFKRKGVDAVILDLRHNTGGSLQEAIDLTGLFIDQGPVVQVKDSSGHVQPYQDFDRGYEWSGPLVVLINKFSASASEILAGAIQDYGRGLIVGDRSTHGKGTVQSLMDLGQQLLRIPNAPKDFGALKLTVQQFYRPSGQSTQNRGVLADVELPSVTTYLDVAEADLDYPLPFDHVKPAEFRKLDYVDESVKDRLSYLSSQRRRNSEGFQEELKRIDRYLERKEKKTITLNEAKFMAQIKERKRDEKEKEKLEELESANDSKIHHDYYLDEALAITVDYLQTAIVAHAN
jgi:carboxyl-terminal processing protease